MPARRRDFILYIGDTFLLADYPVSIDNSSGVIAGGGGGGGLS